MVACRSGGPAERMKNCTVTPASADGREPCFGGGGHNTIKQATVRADADSSTSPFPPLDNSQKVPRAALKTLARQNGRGSNSPQGRLQAWPGDQALRQVGHPGVRIPLWCSYTPGTYNACNKSVEVKDISLTDYIQIRHAVYLPHTAGRYAKKQFKKAQMPIVERLVDRCVLAQVIVPIRKQTSSSPLA